MNPTQLFVYGTLRHDQPEHVKYCRGVTGWRPARLRARSWMLPAGYRIVTVSPAAVLLRATLDAAGDERRRSRITRESIGAIAAAMSAPDADWPWVDGEVLSFRDAVDAWPALDGWEEFSPARPGSYLRVVVPVLLDPAGSPVAIAAWVYGATDDPLGATRDPS